ncbi:MAG: inorganic phosphate transporter [Ignavibacteriae bacterium]|nr:MAG: inorganic phosphate transporter [Ignavibacteriota bacterium]
MITFIIIIILIALVFDFLNGFHDAANSIATIVSTHVLTPRKAVLWAAFFNFLAAFLFTGHNVAKTIGKGLVTPSLVNEYVILAALLGAIAWNIITWYYGIPSSSSHALMGGLGGAAIMRVGFSAIIWSGWIKTLIFIVVAPVLGMVLGFGMMTLLMWMFHNHPSSKINSVFRKLQLVSAAFYSLGHGANDAQKTMGIITILLINAQLIQVTGPDDFPIKWWIIIPCYTAISLGTMFGGWRIVKTMGQKVTKLKPSGGFCAETAGAFTLLITAFSGIAVSTTHTITGAIMGVGATKRVSAVKWGLAGKIVIAWVITLPVTAVISAGCYWFVAHYF